MSSLEFASDAEAAAWFESANLDDEPLEVVEDVVISRNLRVRVVEREEPKP